MTYELCWETSADRPDVLELLGQAFPEPSDFFADIMRRDPWYHYCRRRLRRMEGAILSNVDLFTREIWIGGGRVLVGDLGNVSTHPDHRRKGYCSTVVNDLVSYMNENGYGFSTVYAGAPEFYEGLGWRIFPEKRAVVKVKGDVRTAREYEVQKVNGMGDLTAIAQLYDRCSGQKTGATIRSSDYWHKHLNWLTDAPDHLIVVYRNSEMIGLGRCSITDETASIKEVRYVEEVGSFLEVFVQIVKYICPGGSRTIGAGYFSSEHPLASLDRDDIEVEFRDNSTLRMRLINVKSLFSSMLPQLTNRLEAYASTRYENCITVSCEIGGVALRIRQNDRNS